MATVEGVVELPYITVDEPPGKEGYQAQHPDAEVPSVPHWEQGENPPGTDPPVPPAEDPAITLTPGTTPFAVDPNAVIAPEPEIAGPVNPAITEIPGTHPWPSIVGGPLEAEKEFGLDECDDTDSQTD